MERMGEDSIDLIEKERSLSRLRDEIAMYEPVVELLKLEPGEMGHLQLPIVENISEQHRKTIECVEENKALLI